jgi:hypothetical protein
VEAFLEAIEERIIAITIRIITYNINNINIVYKTIREKANKTSNLMFVINITSYGESFNPSLSERTSLFNYTLLKCFSSD